MGNPRELGEAHAAERSGAAGGKSAAKAVVSAQGATDTDGHSHSTNGQGSSAAGGYNQTSSLVDSDGWNYAGGADGGSNRGRYVTVGSRPPQSHFLLDFAAGLADNYSWGLSEDYTSANSNVNKGSVPYQLGALAGLRGFGKTGFRQLEKTPKTNPELFRNVRGCKGKCSTETGEIWEKDLLHKEQPHFEVYKNKKFYDQGKRDRAVWEDGRLKEEFKR
jgi:hypothetical protein